MSNGLQVTLSASVKGNYTGGNALVNAVAAGLNLSRVETYVTGSGVDGADTLYTQEINIAASSSETLDLATLTDPIGDSIDFARIKAIIILADVANTNDIVLGGGASNPFLGPLGGTTPTIATEPGGLTLLMNRTATAWAVNGSTAHTIKLTNSSSGTGVTGQLIIIGAAE
jgi:hypothetical protein